MSMPVTEEMMIAIHQRHTEREYWTALLARHPERPGFPRDRITRAGASAYRDYSFQPGDDVASLSGGSDQRLLVLLASATGAFLHRCTEAVHFTLGMPVPRQQKDGSALINT